MNEFYKQKYLNDLRKISNYILTYVNAFESGRYALVDEAEDDNIKQHKYTIKHFNEMVSSEVKLALSKYK